MQRPGLIPPPRVNNARLHGEKSAEKKGNLEQKALQSKSSSEKMIA
jgi:hypothetical protein